MWTSSMMMKKISPPAIGLPWAGGFYAGDIISNGSLYHLVVAPRSGGQSSELTWKLAKTATAGTSSLTDGFANSNAMNDASHPAASFCRSLSIGGFTDWYLPAKDELEILYYNLKPTSDNNNTGSGINANAVPPRSSPYTTTAPARTVVSAFQSGGAEEIGPLLSWSSTQAATATAWLMIFSNGSQIVGDKIGTGVMARAVRRIAA
jgi:hypothetical protein